MDKFDLHEMELEYEIVSGTESAYTRPASYTVSGKKVDDNCSCNSGCSCCNGGDDTASKRKSTPVFSGVLMYFPDAIQEIARCSKAGNDQHHPDKQLHWDREKSQDEKDALVRHLMQSGEIDSDGIRHSAKAAWRALANLQKELESENKAPLSEYNGYQW